MPRLETSKKILLVSYSITIILTVIIIIGTFLGYDMSNVTTITSLSFGEVAVSNAFYYRKATRENVPKIIASLSDEFKEQVDINQLLNGGV